MTHDADMNDSGDGEGAGDPVAAFDALRFSVETQGRSLAREMADLRRGVEAAFEAIGHRPDTSVDLARIMKSLGQVSGQLQAIENAQSPIEVAADRYVRKFEESGTAMISAAITLFSKSAHELRGVSEELGERLALAKGHYVRLKFLGLAVAVGVLAGMAMTLFLPAMFPSSVAPRVAALVMRQEPWEAGMKLMKFASAEGWSRVASADELFEANSATVSACRELAAKAKRDQKCPITVAVPAQ